ncbi:MAG: hypothetical protein DRJ52_05650 [Thermoprotei archaeon]|nr:MAG: hypothetical protein DRJ52_05650 [Thermoprotei archaeon]
MRALLLEEPDKVPMFELEVQIAEKIVGKRLITGDEYRRLLREGKAEKLLRHNVEVQVEVCLKLGYDAVRIHAVPDLPEAIRLVRKMAPQLAIIGSADGTLSVPGSYADFTKLIHRMRKERSQLKRELEESIRRNIESAKAQLDAGADAIIGCSDYCTNSGPFLNPRDFEELIAFYLKKLVDAVHKKGGLYIKHTDGNLWPIIDILVSTGIDALHSIDPTAGMDIGEIKEKYGDVLCLCGNIDIGVIHRGSPKEVYEETRACIRKAAYGGGYILCTSNVVERRHPVENVLAMFKARDTYGVYPISRL